MVLQLRGPYVIPLKIRGNEKGEEAGGSPFRRDKGQL